MLKNNLSITVGIPTCYGGRSLFETVDSIRKSKFGKQVKIIIIADRTPITPKILAMLNKLNVILIWNSTEGTQMKKLKQMIKLINSDIYVSTQDDITFDKQTIYQILTAFKNNPNLTMLGTRILPLTPTNFFESIISTMVRLVDRIGRYWNNGNNYLRSSGRCYAFRFSHYSKFRFPETLINGDVFMYLENKRLKGKFKSLENAKVYIRSPQKIKDQLGPSSRFQFSKQEMKKYFKFNLSNEYKIPIDALIRSFLEEFLKYPIETCLYIPVFIYTRINKQERKVVISPLWKVEVTTKKIL